jgi:hypothetical protein
MLEHLYRSMKRTSGLVVNMFVVLQINCTACVKCNLAREIVENAN